MEKTNNTQGELQKQYTPILAFGGNSHKPYIESFYHEPENIVQQPLGTLLGYFEVREYSEESAYIVNFLNSVLKKEYFINSKRSISESFDAALHKVNVALSEIAKHGNVNWLGNLDAAICVLDRNSLHFSVSGQAKILLSRIDTFNEISSGLASESSDPHPLKTFVNVASGRLEPADRIIIASRDVFSLFTQEQLRKNNDRLSNDQFVQFLKTALVNNSGTAHAGIVLISEKKQIAKNKKNKLKTSTAIPANVFSQQAFLPQKQASETEPEKKLTKFEDESEYTDSKTGHIYVQGNHHSTDQENHFNESVSLFLEKMSDSFQHAKNRIRRKITLARKSLCRPHSPFGNLDKTQEENFSDEPITANTAPDAMTAPRKEIDLPEPPLVTKKERPTPSINETVVAKTSSDIHFKKEVNTPIVPKISEEKVPDDEISHKNTEDKPVIKKETFFESYQKELSGILKEKAPEISNSLVKKTTMFLKKTTQEISSMTKRAVIFLKTTIIVIREKKKGKHDIAPRQKLFILPSLSRLKKTFSLLDKKQRIWGFAAISAIILAPWLFTVLSKDKPVTQQMETVVNQTAEQLLATEKNISFSPVISQVGNLQNIVSILPTESGLVYVSKNNISLDGSQPITIPSGEIIYSAYMKDLSLVFLLTSENKILSFSTTTKQFKENNIDLSPNFEIKGIATYLTYLYVADANSDQIYRYPRAEGGFGTKTAWLKESTDLSSVESMAIDENIYISTEEKLTKFFKGRMDPIKFEQSATPIVFSTIYTDLKQSNIYALDKQSSRIVVLDKFSGEIRKQYYDATLASATAIAASEQDKKIYVATSSGIQSISIE